MRMELNAEYDLARAPECHSERVTPYVVRRKHNCDTRMIAAIPIDFEVVIPYSLAVRGTEVCQASDLSRGRSRIALSYEYRAVVGRNVL